MDDYKRQLHSIVVPVYESKSSLETLIKRIADTMHHMDVPFELILIDDGSKDGSFDEIKRLSAHNRFIRGARLSRNFGHQAALTVGLRESRGEFIAIIDDDMQDPPEILPLFFEQIYNGADVAYGIRRKRKENFITRFFYAIIHIINPSFVCPQKIFL